MEVNLFPKPSLTVIKSRKNVSFERAGFLLFALILSSIIVYGILFFSLGHHRRHDLKRLLNRPKTREMKDYKFARKSFFPYEDMLYIADHNVIEPWTEPCHSNLSSNSSSSSTPHMKFLLLITSARKNILQRRLIRKYAPKNFKKVFVLGRNSKLKIGSNIHDEYDKHGDLIIGNFVDSYENLTIKTEVALTYTLKHCQQSFSSVDLIVKMDDDMVVNFHGLEELAKKRYPGILSKSKIKQEKFMSCFSYGNRVNRISTNKHFISLKEYSSKKYPDYCPGSFWMTSVETINRIMSMRSRPEAQIPFKMEDVYHFGMLRTLAGDVKIKRIHPKCVKYSREFRKWIQSNHDNVDILVGGTNGIQRLQQNAYTLMDKLRHKCGLKCVTSPCD